MNRGRTEGGDRGCGGGADVHFLAFSAFFFARANSAHKPRKKENKKAAPGRLGLTSDPSQLKLTTIHVGYGSKQNYQLPFARSFNSNNPNSKDQISLGVSRCHKRLPLLNCHDK
eukprot:scaffold359_cov76-Cyclotella_meneghiniana.AAC.8